MENYQNQSNHLSHGAKIQNNMPLNASGASSLSVNAPEFVPGLPPHQFNQPPQYGFTPYTTQSPIPEIQTYAIQQQQQRMPQISINSRLNQYHPQQPPIAHHPMLNNGAPHPTGRHNMRNGPPRPGGFNSHQNEHVKQNDFEEQHIPSESEDIALNFLTEVINKLEDNPGMFETYQKKLKEMFFELVNNNFVMSNALELLFKQSIKSQNFRYIGARICNLLDDLEASSDSLFRNLLRMKMDFEKQELVKYMQNEQNTVRGTTLFLAELFMQLRRSNDSYRNGEIAESIVFSIQLLLTRIGPENLKCVCQTLKLCGFELDTECAVKTEQIINQLAPYRDSFDTSTGRLIQSVLDLRAKRWGRNESFGMPSSNEMTSQVYSDDPVFYGPDGQVLTEEENSFLTSNVPSYPNINFDELVEDDSDELVDDDDNNIDLEIQLAFKEFVNSNRNTNSSSGGGK